MALATLPATKAVHHSSVPSGQPSTLTPACFSGRSRRLSKDWSVRPRVSGAAPRRSQAWAWIQLSDVLTSRS
eukprot:2160337-Rhodomonas_salina.1